MKSVPRSEFFHPNKLQPLNEKLATKIIEPKLLQSSSQHLAQNYYFTKITSGANKPESSRHNRKAKMSLGSKNHAKYDDVSRYGTTFQRTSTTTTSSTFYDNKTITKPTTTVAINSRKTSTSTTTPFKNPVYRPPTTSTTFQSSTSSTRTFRTTSSSTTTAPPSVTSPYSVTTKRASIFSRRINRKQFTKQKDRNSKSYQSLRRRNGLTRDEILGPPVQYIRAQYHRSGSDVAVSKNEEKEAVFEFETKISVSLDSSGYLMTIIFISQIIIFGMVLYSRSLHQQND